VSRVSDTINRIATPKQKKNVRKPNSSNKTHNKYKKHSKNNNIVLKKTSNEFENKRKIFFFFFETKKSISHIRIFICRGCGNREGTQVLKLNAFF